MNGTLEQATSATSATSATETPAATNLHPLANAVLIPTDLIDLDDTQPRQDWRNDEQPRHLLELADNIKEYGILQPIRVRRTGDRYVVVSGARRRRAADMVKMPEMPAIIEDEPDGRRAEPEELRRIILQLSENLHRHNISQHDEGRAYGRLVRDFNMTPPQIALKVRRTDQYVRELIRVTGNAVLNEASSEAVRLITMSDAREIMKLPDREKEECIARVKAGERVTKKDVNDIRARLAAQGIVNPRMSPRADRPSPLDDEGAEAVAAAGDASAKGETVGVPETASTENLRFVSDEQIRRMADSLVKGARHPTPRNDREAMRQINEDYTISRASAGTTQSLSAPIASSSPPGVADRASTDEPSSSMTASELGAGSDLSAKLLQGDEDDGEPLSAILNRFSVPAEATPVERIVALARRMDAALLITILDTAYENGISLPGLTQIVREGIAV